jgi:phosphohistidine phosphatase
MRIYLLRHGTAEDARHGVSDAERALTDEGWQRLQRAAPAWRALVETPGAVLVSPLRRAQETAVVLTDAVKFRGEVRTERSLLPDAPASLALNQLEVEALSGVQSVVLVGHEPHLGYLLATLLTGHPRQSIPLKKGMLVGVETESSASLVASLRFALSSKAAAEFG